MNAPVTTLEGLLIPAELQSCFDRQRAAYLAEPGPSYSERIADLNPLIGEATCRR
jgi:coniferyl-aldehyde dehydrogenase